MKKIKAAKGAAVCMGLLAAAEAGGTAYFYNIALKRNNAKVERTIKMAGTDWDQYRPMMKVRKEYLLSQPHEDVFLHADDGIRLHATWFPQGNLEKTVICFHGYTSKGMNDFIGLSDYYLKRGYSMLLVDERAHGESEGVYIGFGCLDRWDAMKWIAWAVETCGQQVQILLHGDSMLDLFGKYGITILQGYGMTECAPVISTSVSWNIRKGSVGQLMPNCEAKVVDEELWVKGSSVMQGYYKMPQETKETLVDGWLRTGDLGYVDEEGFVYLTGRKKNLIITKNGENVSPEELENKIGENRLVQEILVREKEGMIEAEIFPDYEYAGKKGITDLQAALQEVIDRYNSGAPSYKKVYRLKVRETEFPKTPSKKIKRY